MHPIQYIHHLLSWFNVLGRNYTSLEQEVHNSRVAMEDLQQENITLHESVAEYQKELADFKERLRASEALRGDLQIEIQNCQENCKKLSETLAKEREELASVNKVLDLNRRRSRRHQ